MSNKKYWQITRIDDELKIWNEVGTTFKVMPTIKKDDRENIIKMQGTPIANFYKVTIEKIEDFDLAMLLIQLWIGKFGMRDVLLDGGSGVNIFSKSLKKKLGSMKKPQPTPFAIMMVD